MGMYDQAPSIYAQMLQNGLDKQFQLSSQAQPVTQFLAGLKQAQMMKMQQDAQDRQDAQDEWQQQKFQEQQDWNRERTGIEDTRYRDNMATQDQYHRDQMAATAGTLQEARNTKIQDVLDKLPGAAGPEAEQRTSFIKAAGGDPNAFGTSQSNAGMAGDNFVGPVTDEHPAEPVKVSMVYNPGQGYLVKKQADDLAAQRESRLQTNTDRAFNQMSAFQSAMFASKNQGGNVADDMPQESIDMLTRAAIKDPDMLNRVGRGKNGDAIRTAIIKNMPVLAQAEGLDTDLVSNRIGLKADSGSLNVMQRTLDNITAFENTSLGNLKRYRDMSKEVVDTGSPLLNRGARAFSSSVLGSSSQAAVDAARMTALTEIAKVITNPNLTSVLSDSARHEVSQFSPREATNAQVAAISDLLIKDMAQRKNDLTNQVKTIKQRVVGTGQTPSAGGFESVIKGTPERQRAMTALSRADTPEKKAKIKAMFEANTGEKL